MDSRPSGTGRCNIYQLLTSLSKGKYGLTIAILSSEGPSRRPNSGRSGEGSGSGPNGVKKALPPWKHAIRERLC